MTVTRFAFKLADGDNTIDLALAMSIVQRTLVRQKQTFTVLGGQLVDNVGGDGTNTTAAVKISTAPNFWYTRAAVNRCFKIWKDQRHRTLENIGEDDAAEKNVGKYADFKVALSGESTSSLLLPHFHNSGAIQPIAGADEYMRASVTDEAGLEKHFRIMGDNNDGGIWYSALHGWLVTRVVPDAEYDPQMLDLDGNATFDYKEDFLNLLNETGSGQPERLTLLYEDNDNAPFPVRDLYGGVTSDHNLQLQSLCYVSNNNPSHMIPGFKALCGLIRVNVEATATNPILFLDVLNTPEAF